MKLKDVAAALRVHASLSKSAAEIVEIQNRKLRRILNHAYRHVPYYRGLFESEGITPQATRTTADLRRLPITEKTRLQQLPLREKTAANVDLNTCRVFTTSGSTGIPLAIPISPRDLTLRNLICARSQAACGSKPWHKLGVIVMNQEVNDRKSWYQYFGLYRRKEVSSWAGPEVWAQLFADWQPDVVMSWATTLRLLGETIAAEPRWRIDPRRIFSSAVRLDPSLRCLLESTFDCPVYDIYTSFEGGCIAWECKICQGYHINADSVIVEVLRDGRPAVPGEEGEVVITNLELTAMPVIRYRQGDVVVLADRESRCGSNFPLLSRISGRLMDYVVLESGRLLAPQSFYSVFSMVGGIRRWRIIQDHLDSLKIQIEPAGDFSRDQEIRLVWKIKQITGKDVRLKLEKVEKIVVDPTTKFRAIVSNIKKPLNGNYD